jgi:hypothetical protein
VDGEGEYVEIHAASYFRIKRKSKPTTRFLLPDSSINVPYGNNRDDELNDEWRPPYFPPGATWAAFPLAVLRTW